MRRLEFASLQVRDLKASTKFYTEKLGFELSEMKNPLATIFRYKKGEASFAIKNATGITDKEELGKGLSIWFTIEALKSRLQQNSVTILGDIMPTPFGRALHIKDLDGYTLTFLEQADNKSHAK